MTKSIKSKMKCGEVRKSNKKGKKIMKLYCEDGKKKLVHAGDVKYGHNYSAKARKSFRSRHKCDDAKKATPKHLACSELWVKGKSVKKRPQKKRK
jgi:hypothetical protein